ncbi:MAG TPA: DUF29 domain-containing protein [Nitrososphaeraceae archaeon]
MNQQHRTDFYGWTRHQADLLRTKEFSKLDMDHLIEEIESMGNSERSRLRSHLKILLMHMLKKSYQPEMATVSWDLSIEGANLEVQEIISENPSLKPELKEILIKSYSLSRINAAKETMLNIDIFPEECPWTLKDIFPDLEKKYW